MVIEKGIMPLTYPASGDLSARQFRCVSQASDGEVQAAGAGAVVVGILQNKPAAAGRAASVVGNAGAITKVHASSTGGAAIAIGDALVSGANGIALRQAEAGGSTGYVFGRAASALSSGSTGIISVRITHEGMASS